MVLNGFDRWFPIRVYAAPSGLRVQWFLGDDGLRFEDRYFHDTVARAAKRPFNLAFYRDTGVDVLHDVANRANAIDPKGFIYHLSRCGSTLVSNAFAARSDVLLLAEAGPVNDVLVLAGIAPDERLALLRSIMRVLSRPQRTGQIACVVKLDAWHVRSMDVINAAFPGVPWVFLHRDPREVLVSHLRLPSLMMSPVNAPATLGVSLVDAARVPREEHCANVLAELLNAMRARSPDRSHLVDYTELPEAIWERIGPAFGLPFSERAVTRIRAAAAAHAKDPRRPFEPDAAEKRAAAELLPDSLTSALADAYRWFNRPIVR